MTPRSGQASPEIATQSVTQVVDVHGVALGRIKKQSALCFRKFVTSQSSGLGPVRKVATSRCSGFAAAHQS